MRLRRRQPEPEPAPIMPQGVVITYSDGHRDVATLIYIGTDSDGLHVWEIANTSDGFVSLDIAMLPARTTVRMPR